MPWRSRLDREVVNLTQRKARAVVTWGHAWDLVAIDFCVVPTATFRILFGFIALKHYCRRVHFNVTAHPTL